MKTKIVADFQICINVPLKSFQLPDNESDPGSGLLRSISEKTKKSVNGNQLTCFYRSRSVGLKSLTTNVPHHIETSPLISIANQ